MMVASGVGSGSGVSFSTLPSNINIGSTQTSDKIQTSTQIVGDSSTSNGQNIPVKSSEKLADGSIKELLLKYLLKDDEDKDKKDDNRTALMMANNLYNLASNLQSKAGINPTDSSQGINAANLGSRAGGGRGAGGGIIAR